MAAHHDEMIWHIINNQFCSYKTTFGTAKSDKQSFCKHPYSVTGLCNRSSCPLANARYAVVREHEGKVNLFIKTVERAHSPKNLWEKIHLSRNYDKALAQLDEHLAYFPKTLIHRNKQRLTKIHQMLIRMRKIKLKERAGRKGKLVGINRKIEQREERREKKALIAAHIENNIEKELVDRLAKGTYGDIYDFEEAGFQQAIEKLEEQQDDEEEESEEEYDSEEEDGLVEYVEDLEDEESEEEDLEEMAEGRWQDEDDDDDDASSDEESSEESSDDEDDSSDEESSDDGESPSAAKSKRDKRKRRPRGTRVEIEYEDEEAEEEPMQEEAIAGSAW